MDPRVDLYTLENLREAPPAALEPPFVSVRCALVGFETMDLDEAKEKHGDAMSQALLQYSEVSRTGF